MQTDESYANGTADLIRLHSLQTDSDLLALQRSAAASPEDSILDRHDRPQAVADLMERIDTRNPVTYFRLCQTSISLATSAEIVFATNDALDGIRSMPFADGGEPFAFPNASAYWFTRSDKIMQRQKIPSIWLRIEQDAVLAAGSTEHLRSSQDLAFRASSELSGGALLMDAYLGPLLACLTPYIWAVPSYHTYGTIILVPGRPINGLSNDVVEGLHLAPTATTRSSVPVPALTPESYGAALRWWSAALNSMFSVSTDPAIFTDQDGIYKPSKHLQGLLTLEQLFKRTASLLTSYRDSEVTRVLFFTVMDTLERLTGKSLDDMCNLDKASKTLKALEENLPAEASDLLLGAARRGVRALDALQLGFFMRSGGDVEFDLGGTPRTLALPVASARYLKVLRNATHGHGSSRSANEALTSALLAHHTGKIPHDLPLLAFMYLLDILVRPDILARRLYNNGN